MSMYGIFFFFFFFFFFFEMKIGYLFPPSWVPLSKQKKNWGGGGGEGPILPTKFRYTCPNKFHLNRSKTVVGGVREQTHGNA